MTLVVIATALVAGCGDPDAHKGGGEREPGAQNQSAGEPVALPLPVTGRQMAVVPVGATGEFVILDGRTGDGKRLWADLWAVRDGQARLLEHLDTPVLGPQGWQASDGTVHIVGIDCENSSPEDGEPCGAAPLTWLRVDGDKVRRDTLDIRTSSNVSVLAIGVGDGAVVAAGRGTLTSPDLARTAYWVATDGKVTRLGEIGDARLCADGDRAVAFPASLDEPAAIREIRDGVIAEVGRVEPIPAELAEVLGCSEGGSALVGIMGPEISYRTLSADGTYSELRLDSPVGLEPGNGTLFSWDVEEGDEIERTWVLTEHRGDERVQVGKTTAGEAPRLTTRSGETVIAVSSRDGEKLLEEIG